MLIFTRLNTRSDFSKKAFNPQSVHLVKCLLALLISTLGFVSACIGQSYTWNANFGEADWQDPNSWTPARNAPSINDQLYFSNGGSSIATNIPSETVGFIFLENASQVTFHSAFPGNSLTMLGSSMVKLYLDWNTSLVVGDGDIAMNIQFTGAPSDIAEVLGSLMITPMCALNTTNSDFQLVGELTISGSLQGDVVNNGVITFDHSNQLTYNGSISGIGSLNKSGSGTLSLTGASSYDGLTSVQQGVLNLQNNNALGSSVGGTLVQSGAQLELQGDIEINNESLTLNQSSTGLEAQGGIVTVVGDFTTHTFSDIGSSILSVLSAGQADVLIVGGGGGGGMGTGGGGGGGGFIELLGYTMNEGDVSITIGSGGNGASATQSPTNGEDSSFGSMVAAGGGFGGGLPSAGGNGSPGASGGGGSWGNTTAGAFTAGQGNAGGSGRLGSGNICSFDPYSAGGGGGAGGNGENGSITKSGDGGDGLYSAISGTPIGYCGGGGGGADSYRCTYQGIASPEFGGGNGGYQSPGLDAVNGRGGGGGGGSNAPNQSGGHGGSGVVIVRYANTTLNAIENVAGNNRWNGPVILNTDVTIHTTSGELTISGIISENVNNMALTKTGTGTLTLDGTNTYTGVTNISGGTLQLGAGGTTGSISNSSNVTNNGTLLFNRSNYLQYTGVVSGTGALIKSGNVILELTNDHSYTGTTTINGGTLQLGITAGGTTGSISNSSNVVLNGSGTELYISRSNNYSYSGVISGTGGVTKGNHASTLILTGTNTYTGNTTIQSTGILSLGSGGTTGSIDPASLVVVNGELQINRSNNYSLGNNIFGGGRLTHLGTGTTTLTNTSNAYTGLTTITSGTLQLGASNVIDNTSNMVLNGGTFRTGATSGFAETLGTLNLSASSTIALGTGVHTLTFANSIAVSWTAATTLTITGWTGTAGATGTAGKIFVGNSADGLNDLQLSQINFNGYGSGSMLLATGELVPLEVVVGCTNPSACNFNPDATTDDGSCIAAIGEPGTPSSTPNVCVNSPLTSTCNPSGNVVIYANYDGGILNINVDQNIPNLRIGVISYEDVQVNIVGPFAANVAQVLYVGLQGDGDNCNLGVSATVINAPVGVSTQVLLAPPSVLVDPDGNNSMICAYSCDEGNQGGCNTAEQVVAYFLNQFGGSLYAYNTQYACWPNSALNVSAAGSCCPGSQPLTITTTGATGIGSATGLPPGVTASWSNNVITISGIPTVAGVFNYSIPLTGGCGTVNATGTITVNAATPVALECWQTLAYNSSTGVCDIVGSQPSQPTTACWQTAVFDDVICDWVLTGTQPQQPAQVNCWDAFVFNTTTCQWENTGSQDPEPTNLGCGLTTDFNEITCVWDLVGDIPPQPSQLNCWDDFVFNTTDCEWQNIGAQDPQPNIDCWENPNFNNTTCAWEVTGSQPTQPSIECWETATFNNTTCTWDVSGTQPQQPSLECWESATFNNTTCVWDISGTQLQQPATACYESAQFNDATCTWDVSGNQPAEPQTECWETAIFNNTTCAWEVSGTQPQQPATACYETAQFNDATCTWDVSGNQPPQPQTECWESATFNNITCAWEVSGTQPQQPSTACYETAQFNDATCTWDVSGNQPAEPQTECWETANFNSTTCAWEVSGTQPQQPSLECWESASFNNTSCIWDVSGSAPVQPAIACYESAQFNDVTCAWEVSGTQPPQPELECYEAATFNNVSCSWVITGAPFSISIDAFPYSSYAPWSTTFSLTANGDILSTEWLVDGVIQDSIETLDYTFSDNESYEVIAHAVSSGGCLATDTLRFTLEEFTSQFIVPNCFTPNFDGYNDFFTVETEHIATFEMRIYNRWGVLVFETRSMKPGWNGYSENDLAYPDGTYVYIIKAIGQDGKKYEKSGSVIMMR